MNLASNQVLSPMVAPRCESQMVTCDKYSTVKLVNTCIIRSHNHSNSVTSMLFKHRVDRQQVAQVMRVVKTRPKLSHISPPPSSRLGRRRPLRKLSQ